MSEFAQFLIVRSEDLVILGLNWTGFRVRPAGPEAPPELVAEGEGARVTLTFPPQALGEEKFDVAGDARLRGARLAGSSRVTFQVRDGTVIPLSPEGVLLALGGRALVSGAGLLTAIELPWHLIISAQALSGAEVVSAHFPLPVVSDTGTAGLWRLRLQAAEAGLDDARLALLPLDLSQDDAGLDVAPLSGGQRRDIFDALPEMAQTRRLELSALGGSLSAYLTSRAIDWDHDTVLGRDQHVRVVQRGVLYPFGHRAEYTVIAERVFDPAGPGSVAGLHRQRMLVITEPVRMMDGGDARLTRQFPFHEVEICARRFTDLAPDVFQFHTRDPFPHDDLLADITLAQEKLQPLLNMFGEILAQQPQTLQDYMQSELGSAPALRHAQIMEALDPDAMKARQLALEADIKALLLSIPVDPPPPPPRFEDESSPPPPPREPFDATAILEEVARLREEQALVSDAVIAQVRAEQAFWDQEVIRLQAEVEREFFSSDTVDELIDVFDAGFDPSAQEVKALRALIKSREDEIEAIRLESETEHDVFWSPRTSDGQLLRFPLRCAGANGDLFFSVPLVFVKDVDLPGSDRFPAFHALTDESIALRLADEWKPSRDVQLPGERIDLLRSPRSQPNDMQEVHMLALAGVSHSGGFRPILEQVTAELPALRALLPGQAGRTALKFSEEFLAAGDQVEVGLKMVDRILVDFTEQADRSGGLVAPKFAADIISRTLGPVAKGALPGLPGGLPNLASVYSGATLLGFPLGEVIKMDGLPKPPLPPLLTQVLQSGKPPGVRMEWKDLKLKSHGPFQAGDDTLLDLTVETSLEKTQTKCTVANFSLILPPSSPQLTLRFRSLVFTQEPGRAPDLQVNGLKVEFTGALELLRKLQEKLQGFLDLGSSAPVVRANPDGITASYTLCVPDAKAGAFLLRNIAVYVAVDIPFSRRPVTVSLAFASRENPFNLSVLMFGGGGYIDVQIGPSGLTRLEASLEFGAMVAVDFLIASGEVHALGGMTLVQRGGEIEFEAFLRFGGSVEVLGLVSVSVELRLALRYESQGNRLVGRATLVIEIDITLYADSVELDSGEWVLSGSEEPPAPVPPPAPAIPAAAPAEDAARRAWREYQEAFAR